MTISKLLVLGRGLFKSTEPYSEVALCATQQRKISWIKVVTALQGYIVSIYCWICDAAALYLMTFPRTAWLQ